MLTICLVCYKEYEDESLYKPRTYCSDNCRNYMKYKNALEKSIIALKPTLEAKKIIKGDMFRLSNLVCIGTFTKKDLK